MQTDFDVIFMKSLCFWLLECLLTNLREFVFDANICLDILKKFFFFFFHSDIAPDFFFFFFFFFFF